jgi:hypothetical protein
MKGYMDFGTKAWNIRISETTPQHFNTLGVIPPLSYS